MAIIFLRKELNKVDEMLVLISEYGFPVVITLYLLHRVETKLDTLIQSIHDLPNQLEKRETKKYESFKQSM